MMDIPKRNILLQEDLVIRDSFIENRNKNQVIQYLKHVDYKECLLNKIPFLTWIQEYSCRNDLIFDLIAGMTVTMLQIPQSIAYGYLASVPPICGLYCGCFTSFVYVFFGTSKHISVGTFAVVSLMVGKTVSLYSSLNSHGMPLDHPGEYSELIGEFRNIDILAAVTFTVSLFHLIMFICQLGVICNLISEILINAFSIACAVHIVVSQIQDFFGIHIHPAQGYFTVFKTINDMSKSLSDINPITTSIASVTLLILVLHNQIVKPWLSKKCKFPFPIELLIVIFGIGFSYYMDLERKYNVKIVSHIPQGIPYPKLPNFQLIKHIIGDSLVIALVSYVISQSINLMFARKGEYQIDTNQEALAMSMMNLFGSFLMAIPVSTSLVRSMLQFNVGGVSQISSGTTAVLLLLVIVWVGPVFEYLPRCLLSSIVLSTVYSAFMHLKNLKLFWKHSKFDVFIWSIIFFLVVVIDVSYGIYAALILSVIALAIDTLFPTAYILGLVPGTEIYLELARYQQAQEIPKIKIFRYNGGYNFCSKKFFRKNIENLTGVNAVNIIEKRKKFEKRNEPVPDLEFDTKVIIVDFSGITNIDASGVESFERIQKSYHLIGIKTMIANPTGRIYDKILKWNIIEKKENNFLIFPTIHDAVLYSIRNILK